jgi:L-cysteate sulfo-lyase
MTAGLLHGPTPLERADRLGTAIGLAPGQLWVKRDDLTPLAGGGNKVRKLDHLCGAALAAGADVLVTGGAPQSNHVRLTAAAARRLGLDVVAVMSGDAPPRASGNLVVDALLGVELVWTGRESLAEVESVLDHVGRRLSAAGRRPYVIPLGGANALGSQGYVAAADELIWQLPDLDLVVVPSSTGGTHAGLVAGLGSHEKVLGVSAAAFVDVEDRVGRLAAEAAELAGREPPIGRPWVDMRYAADGYAAVLDVVADAMRLAARTEALVLDPVYTGKALAGLAEGIADGSVRPAGPVVFVHCGGAYGLLSDRLGAWAAGDLGRLATPARGQRS